MANTRALQFAAIVAGVLIVCGPLHAQNALLVSTTETLGSASPAVLTQAPNSPANTPMSPMQRMPRTVTPHPRPQGKPMSIDDLLSGITLTDEQKPKIEQVRKDMRTRMDAVVHDKNENVDQKQAMLQGLQHMELRAVYQLLTPEQQGEVRKKVAAQQSSQQQPSQGVQHTPQPK